MNKLATIMFVSFMGVLISACSTNPILENNLEEQEETLLITKRNIQNGNTITLYGNTDFTVWNVQGNYIEGTFNGNTSPYTFTYNSDRKITRADGGYFIVGNNFGGESISNTTNEFIIHTGLAQTTFYFTTASAPQVTIYNDFPSGTGAYIQALDDDLEYIFHIAPQTSQTFTLENLFQSNLGNLNYIDIFASTNDNLNVGSTKWGDDLLSNQRRYHLYENDTHENLYFSIGGDYLLLINESYQDFNYYQGSVDYSTSIYYTIEARETLTITPEMQTTVWGSIPFQIEYNGSQIVSLYSNKVDSIFYHKYYLTFTQPIYNMTINLEGGLPDTPESILSNTFTTIASSLESLIPILNLSVFGNVTIGFLLLIPFTYALIRLIMRLIKK